MSATIVLCLLSTLSFCVCARALLWVAPMYRRPALYVSGTFSARAMRLALGYVLLALFVLAAFSLLGAVRSYIELFQLKM